MPADTGNMTGRTAGLSRKLRRNKGNFSTVKSITKGKESTGWVLWHDGHTREKLRQASSQIGRNCPL